MKRLIIRPGGIGDTIVAFPAMEHLRADYTEVWVRSEVVPLIKFADRTCSIAASGIDMLGLSLVPPRLDVHSKLATFDEIWSWYGTRRDEFRAEMQAHPFHFLEGLPKDEKLHAGDFFASQVGAPAPAIPAIALDPIRHGRAVVHPFSGSPSKDWSYANFRAVAKALDAEWAADTGGFKFDNLHRLAAWLAGAGVYIGNDTGITHLAAAVGTPVVALFGPTKPAVWAPRGANVRVIARPSLDEISVEEVLQAASECRRAA